MHIKNWTMVTALILMFTSCEPESSSCHNGISIVNSSNIPIRVCKIWGYVSENTTYAMRDDADKVIVFPGDTTFMEITDLEWRDCLEDRLEWSSSHPDYYDPSLRTIYICDTIRPTQTFYSTPDDVLRNHNILKQISVVDTGIDRLKRKNFIIQYP